LSLTYSEKSIKLQNNTGQIFKQQCKVRNHILFYACVIIFRAFVGNGPTSVEAHEPLLIFSFVLLSNVDRRHRRS